MTYNQFGTNSAFTNKLWALDSEKLYRDSAKESYFLPRFGSEGDSSIVMIFNQFEKSAGDRIRFGIRMRQTDEWLNDTDTMINNEGDLDFYYFDQTLTRIKTAIEFSSKGMDKQRVQMDLPMEVRNALKDKVAEKIDSLLFAALASSRTKTFYNSNGTFAAEDTFAAAKSAIASTDKLTPQFIGKLKTWALTGGNRSQVPIRPIKVDGRDTYVFLAHPDAINDLKNDSTYAQAQREAADRGKNNPLFTGAVGVWDNVVIHEHENITIGTNAGGSANLPYSEGYLLGAQALCWGWGPREEIEVELKDYKQRTGYQAAITYAAGRPIFNSTDYGSLCAIVNRTQTSDI